LDWSDQIDARMGSVSEAAPEQPPEPEAATKGKGRDKKGGELLPALAAMMEDRKADEAARVEAARVAANVVLPESAWHEIQQRAGERRGRPGSRGVRVDPRAYRDRRDHCPHLPGQSGQPDPEQRR